MAQVESPYPAEARNFLGEELVVGRCNSSDGAAAGDDDGPSAPASLDDVLHFLTVRLNTTSKMRYYGNLGFRTYEGAWTGLLGALMDQSVDVALEPVTAHPPRHQDMDFIFPIAETMCNIYIRHQETSTVRDIFLAPFSPRLVVSVAAVVVVAALAVVLVSRLTPTLRGKHRPLGYTEALVWSTGILCQQGGTWTPPTPAASVLLIVCLLFAVVTYNAYAAFITSVLSVRVASLDTVAAVLHSPDFKIGYIRNGADQMYLMSTKDAQLNAFYIRGYSDAENLVTSAEEGLARAAQQNYAFFAGQRAARSTLRSLSQARGRCAVRELPVYSTRAHLAFPLPRRSPYARPILVGLLQLRSGGALERLESALVPAMPQCAPPPGFASARAADVRSALILLLVGLVTALMLGEDDYFTSPLFHLFVLVWST
ncbi:glutamate receptor U1-like [Pectinophora gossypiella]|uniref:glutamate receptor U1-like n=1 Tax=Pectinophora gossypiella TaxID=13191 RepID=UPI00214F52E2|nr:glutamate receptor U1-like [Pectinophora gossypiella]